MIKFVGSLCLVALMISLTGCIETWEPAIEEGTQDDFGPVLDLKMWMPHVSADATTKEGPRSSDVEPPPISNYGPLALHFERKDHNHYVLIFTGADGSLVGLPSYAKIKRMGTYDGYQLLLIDA